MPFIQVDEKLLIGNSVYYPSSGISSDTTLLALAGVADKIISDKIILDISPERDYKLIKGRNREWWFCSSRTQQNRFRTEDT